MSEALRPDQAHDARNGVQCLMGLFILMSRVECGAELHLLLDHAREQLVRIGRAVEHCRGSGHE